MLEPAEPACQIRTPPELGCNPLSRGEICPHPDTGADCASYFPGGGVTIIASLIAVAACVTALAWALRRGGQRKQRAFTGVLDAADAFEDRLRTARAELEAITGNEDNPVREAMQEMLRQRLWLQQHGATASAARLDEVRAAIDEARARIEQQLDRIERARAHTP